MRGEREIEKKWKCVISKLEPWWRREHEKEVNSRQRK
jgi:hypothetical protein